MVPLRTPDRARAAVTVSGSNSTPHRGTFKLQDPPSLGLAGLGAELSPWSDSPPSPWPPVPRLQCRVPFDTVRPQAQPEAGPVSQARVRRRRQHVPVVCASS